MSAASEATLQDLLQTSKGMALSISRLASKMGADLSGIDDASGRLEELGISSNKAGSILNNLAKAVGSSISAVYDLGKTSSNAGVSVSGFYTSLASLLPADGVFNRLALATSALMQEFEGNQKVYNDLIRSGASFSGSLMNVATVAGKAYMTMDQFANVVKQNADAFRLMGPTVQSGMTRFVDIQNQMLGEKSPYARAINALTGGSEGAAEALGNYMRSQASMNKQSLMSTERIIQGTIEYAREMDALSKITGKRKEQIEKEYQEVVAEESFQEYLSTLDADKADAARAAINTARQTFGKDVADQLRTAIQTGISTPLTEGQQNMFLMTGGATQKFVEQTMISVNQGKKVADIQKEVVDSARETYKFYKEFAGQNSTVLGVNAAFGTGLQAKTSAVLGQIGRMNSAQEALEKIRKEQIDQEKGSATALTIAQQRINELGAKINELREKILDPIISSMANLTGRFTSTITDVLKSDFVTNLTDELGKAFSGLNEKIQSGELIEELKSKIKGFYDKITKIFSAEGVTGVIDAAFDAVSFTGQLASQVGNSIVEMFGPVMMALFNKVSNYAMNLIEKYVPGVDTIDEDIAKKQKEIDNVKKKLEIAGTPGSGVRKADLEKLLTELEPQLAKLKEEKAARTMSFSELLEKYKKELKQPTPPTTTSPALSRNEYETKRGNNVSGESTQVVGSNMVNPTNNPTALTAEQVDKLITYNKEFGEILNNKLEELIKVARESNDTSSKTITAINRLNNDGFAMVSG